MSLHQIQTGTQVTIRSTGDSGLIKEVFYFPTMYNVEMKNGEVEKFTTHQIEIDGIQRENPGIIEEANLNTLDSGKSYDLGLFNVKTVVWQEISAQKTEIWKRLISLKDYHLWYPGIQRILPLNDMGRYVHQYSFDQFNLKPGSHIRTRSNSLLPFLNGRIVDIKNEELFSLSLKINPLLNELVKFELNKKDDKVLLSCTRSYQGLFSLLGYLGFHKNTSLLLKDFQNLFFPSILVDEIVKEEKIDEDESMPKMDRETTIAYGVNKAMTGDMEFINSIPDKPTRGLAKAALVKAKRTGIVPPMPKINPEKVSKTLTKAKSSSNGIPVFEDKQDLIHYAVNKALDGEMDVINSIEEKPIRGKAKAMMVKCKRTGERPPMPEINLKTKLNTSEVEKVEPEEELITRLVADGVKGIMDEINALDNRVLRGKIKASIVREKRKGNG